MEKFDVIITNGKKDSEESINGKQWEAINKVARILQDEYGLTVAVTNFYIDYNK